MDNIDILENNNTIWLQKIPHKITIWVVIIIMGLITLGFFICCYPYNNIKIYEGLVQKNDLGYYINILVLENDINNITDKKLLINNKDRKYQIANISDDYYLDNNNKYREVTLKTTIDKKSIINNNILELKFIVGKTTIYQIFKERIKKGMI